MEGATQSGARTGTLITEEVLDGKIFSGGWRETGDRLDVHNPATDEHLASVGNSARDDVLKASKLAAEAQPEWAATPGPERAKLLHAAADALESAHEEIEWWLINEGGGVPQKAAFEVGEAAKELRAAAALTSMPVGEVLPNEQGRISMAKRLPVGVVGVIAPWNFPMILAMRSVAPALALGNSVLLKCDPHTPVSGGLVFARAFEEAGWPENVFQVLPGGVEPGEAICEAPEVRMVSFTGSTRAGRAVGALAGGNLKRVAVELGGKSSVILLDDPDSEKATACGRFGTFFPQGQICMASGRDPGHAATSDSGPSCIRARSAWPPAGIWSTSRSPTSTSPSSPSAAGGFRSGIPRRRRWPSGPSSIAARSIASRRSSTTPWVPGRSSGRAARATRPTSRRRCLPRSRGTCAPGTRRSSGRSRR